MSEPAPTPPSPEPARAAEPAPALEPAPDAAPPPAPRRRPVLVELASALLIVSGAMNLLISVQVLGILGEQGSDTGPLSLVTIVVAIATLLLGFLVRYGRAWLVAVNVVAVVAFLELTSGSPVGLLFGGVDTFVVIALLIERPWFTNPAPEPESDLRSYGG
jgi:hypothetical protein